MAQITWPDRRQQRIVEIKSEAGRRILGRYPDYKQRNALARLAELQDKRLDGVTLTRAEQDEIAAMRTVWGWVRATRTASDDAEAKVMAATSIAEVDAVVPVWPA